MNIEKKHVFLIVGALLLVALVIGVYAYNSSPANPAVMGHSINEISGVPDCIAGQALTKVSGGWSCVDLPSPGTSITPYLGSSGHIGGTVAAAAYYNCGSFPGTQWVWVSGDVGICVYR